MVHGIGAVQPRPAAARRRHGADGVRGPGPRRAGRVLRAPAGPPQRRRAAGVLLRPHRGRDRSPRRPRHAGHLHQPARRGPPQRLRRRRGRRLQRHPPPDQPRPPPHRLRPHRQRPRLQLQLTRTPPRLPAGTHRGEHPAGRRPGRHHATPRQARHHTGGRKPAEPARTAHSDLRRTGRTGRFCHLDPAHRTDRGTRTDLGRRFRRPADGRLARPVHSGPVPLGHGPRRRRTGPGTHQRPRRGPRPAHRPAHPPDPARNRGPAEGRNV